MCWYLEDYDQFAQGEISDFRLESHTLRFRSSVNDA